MNLKTLKIGVLSGGLSTEADISKRSADTVYQTLVSAGYQAEKVNVDQNFLSKLTELPFDVYYNALHGSFGEDGQLQGFFDFIKAPYTGEGQLTSCLCFHKVKTKEILRSHFIPTAKWLVGLEGYASIKDLRDELFFRGMELPLVLKPISEGSSHGVRLLKTEDALQHACKEIFDEKKHGDFFIETYLPGREVTVGICHWQGKWEVLPILEIKSKKEFYDYEAKYTPGMTDLIVPAPISDIIKIKLEQTTEKIAKIFEFRQCARVDYRISDKGEIHVLEVNTSPGMTETSDIPKMLETQGISLIDFFTHQLEQVLNKIP